MPDFENQEWWVNAFGKLLSLIGYILPSIVGGIGSVGSVMALLPIHSMYYSKRAPIIHPMVYSNFLQQEVYARCHMRITYATLMSNNQTAIVGCEHNIPSKKSGFIMIIPPMTRIINPNANTCTWESKLCRFYDSQEG